MFGLQKKSSTEENKNESLNLSQQKDLTIEEMPIHTMREDLENLRKPLVSHGTISSPPQEKKIPTDYGTLSQKQKTSPFLNLSNEDLPRINTTVNEKPRALEIKNASVKTIRDNRSDLSFLPAKERESEHKSASSLAKNSGISKINWRLILFSASFFILIAILITVGYYFSQNKINLSDLLINPFSAKPNIPPAVEVPAEAPIEKPVLSYSQTNPNYLRLEGADSDAEKIKTILQQYIQKVSQEGYAAPVEFIVTDSRNAPLAFNDFAAKIGLKLSRQIMENLGSNFSLFVYNDVSVTRIGLSADLSMESKNNDKMAKVLLQEEKALADELNPLFFTTDYNTEKVFANSEYNTVKIRFQNIISPDNLSVDYAIDKNKLLIGMTKLTLRAVIDRANTIAPQE